MNHILLRKQEPIFITTKSLNQNIKAQLSDEIQLLEIYENSTVVFTICCYRNKKARLICFPQEDDTDTLIYTT